VAKKLNYGPEIFLRRVDRFIRYLFIDIYGSIAVGLVSGLAYVHFMKPMPGSWSMIPDFAVAQARWFLRNEESSHRTSLAIQNYLIRNTPFFKMAAWIAIGMAVVSFFLLGFIFWRVGKKNQEDSHVRGSQIIPLKQLQKDLIDASKFGFSNGYVLGSSGLRIPEEYIWRGFAFAGRPGTGKSNLIRILLNQDLNRRAKCFIIDINGDYWRKFGRPGKDKILSLRHKDSEYWDFKCEDVVPSLLASYLVPKSNSGPAFWWKAGRAVLASLIEHSEDLDDFKIQIAESDGNILKLLNSYDDLAIRVLGKEGSQQSMGVLGNTVLDFSFIKDLGYWPKQAGKDKPFSITEWAKNPDDLSWVYVIVRDDELEEIRPLVSCWFNLTVNGCFRRDESRCYAQEYPSIRLYLDELKSLGKLEDIEKGGERLRKYLGSIIAGYQNDAQLDIIYGQQGAKNLKDVLQNKVIYSIGEPGAQEDLSRYLGEHEVEEYSDNTTYGEKRNGHSESRKMTRRRSVLPSEIGQLRDGDCYIKIGAFDPIKTHIEVVKFPNINRELEWGIPPRKKVEKSVQNAAPEANSNRSLRRAVSFKKGAPASEPSLEELSEIILEDIKHQGDFF
jgi:hypothetical protein